jgi:hypothetical protein
MIRNIRFFDSLIGTRKRKPNLGDLYKKTYFLPERRGYLSDFNVVF